MAPSLLLKINRGTSSNATFTELLLFACKNSRAWALAMPLKVKIRYGIGEWYGRDFSALTVPEMKELVRAQFRELDCPFRPGKCNKKGGVCSLREFALTERGVVATGPIVTTCPQRFLQAGRIFEWIGQTLLGAKEPSVLKALRCFLWVTQSVRLSHVIALRYACSRSNPA
jgi:restriction endonuclease NotI